MPFLPPLPCTPDFTDEDRRPRWGQATCLMSYTKTLSYAENWSRFLGSYWALFDYLLLYLVSTTLTEFSLFLERKFLCHWRIIKPYLSTGQPLGALNTWLHAGARTLVFCLPLRGSGKGFWETLWGANWHMALSLVWHTDNSDGGVAGAT